MERYLAICHPLHSYAMSGLRRALRIIGALWIIGFVSATPFAVYTTVHYVDYPPGRHLQFNISSMIYRIFMIPRKPIPQTSYFLLATFEHTEVNFQTFTAAVSPNWRSVDTTVTGCCHSSQMLFSKIRSSVNFSCQSAGLRK